GLRTIALGHTADDRVEGVILHLLRGAGLAGMRGMPERRGPFVRPLLGVWRSQVEQFLEARATVPLRDPSNLDRRFARVRVRVDLLTRLEEDRRGLTLHLHTAARRAAELQLTLEAEASRLLGADPRRVALAELKEATPAAKPRWPSISRRAPGSDWAPAGQGFGCGPSRVAGRASCRTSWSTRMCRATCATSSRWYSRTASWRGSRVFQSTLAGPPPRAFDQFTLRWWGLQGPC